MAWKLNFLDQIKCVQCATEAILVINVEVIKLWMVSWSNFVFKNEKRWNVAEQSTHKWDFSHAHVHTHTHACTYTKQLMAGAWCASSCWINASKYAQKWMLTDASSFSSKTFVLNFLLFLG